MDFVFDSPEHINTNTVFRFEPNTYVRKCFYTRGDRCCIKTTATCKFHAVECNRNGDAWDDWECRVTIDPTQDTTAVPTEVCHAPDQNGHYLFN